jgi:hypothetical protein
LAIKTPCPPYNKTFLLKFMENETILIILGAILIGIGIVGGNLQWKEIRIPKIHIAARILGFITGLALIVVGPNIGGLLTIQNNGNNSVEETEKTLQAQEQRLAELQRQQEEAQKAIAAEKQRLAELQRQLGAAQKARQAQEQRLAQLRLEKENLESNINTLIEMMEPGRLGKHL